MPVKHKFVSPKADATDATLVRPSNWNDEHDVNLAESDIPPEIARDAEVTSAINTHGALITGVHGVGASIVESVLGSQGKVDTHAVLSASHGRTNIDGVTERDAAITAHAALPTVHQDAPALILAHKGDASAHHAKYTDGEAAAVASGLITTHTADLAAHTRHYWQILAIGEYYIYLPISNSGIAVTTNLLRAELFYVPRNMTFDRIAIAVQTLEAAPNDGIVIGIYNSHATTLYPTTLIALSGGVVSTATTGTKAVTINISLTKGLYYLAHHHQSNVRKIFGKTTNLELPTPLGSWVTGDLNPYFCCGFSDTTTAYSGTLPATFPAAGARLYYAHQIGLRLANLD